MLIVDRVAVLLPGQATDSDLSCAASMYPELDVIWQGCCNLCTQSSSATAIVRPPPLPSGLKMTTTC